MTHAHYSEELRQELDERGFLRVFLYRDPRAILVSTVKYVMEIVDIRKENRPNVRRTWEILSRFATDSERLLEAIGMKGWGGVVHNFRECAGWLDDDRTFVTSYEKIVGSAGGGSDPIRRTELTRLLTYLGRPQDSGLVELMIERGAERKRTPKCPTFRQGRINGWQEDLHPSHLHALYGELGSLLGRYGYSG